MNDSFASFAKKVADRGWKVKRFQKPADMPTAISQRYHWLPADVVSFLSVFESVLSPNETSWLNTCADLLGEADGAFRWDEWEQLSLKSAADDGDLEWQQSIRAFWDKHFPLLMSVKSGYSYIAIRSDLKFVDGVEPDFEATSVFAGDFVEFLKQLGDGDARLECFV